jgi:TonB-linked SusC/RagA family outer membrane protein
MKRTHLVGICFAVIIIGFASITDTYAQAQETKKITGTVIDANNEAVIGASVSVLGAPLGTVTDINGDFELSTLVGSTLKVSYIGFTTYQEKITASKNRYPITLQEDFQALDELVVVGYGTQRRSDLTGSISSIKTGEIKDFSAKSLSEAISGMAAGVMVTKNDGTPGSSADIIIRGVGSINGISPLYIVDGVRQGTGFNFNMRDVESIEILKDAGSSAIYGAQAAGGVILITTKRGSEGKTTVNANARYGLRNITTDIKLLNRDDFIRAKSYMGSDMLAASGVQNAADLPDVDWMDLMYDTGIEQEYNVSVSGSTEKANFFLSGGYYSEKGAYLDTQADRFSFRTNLDYKLSKHITIGESLYGNLRKTNPSKNYSVYTNVLPFRTVPTMEPLDPDQPSGFAKTPPYLNGPNLYGNELSYHVFNDNNYTLNAQAFLNINFIKGLDLRITGAGEFYGFSKSTFTEAINFGPAIQEKESMNAYGGTFQNLTFNAILTYDKDFGDHSLKLMAGTEALKNDGYNLEATAWNFPVRIAESMRLSGDEPNKAAIDNLMEGRTLSYFGRVNYSYQGKYLFTANIRRDGSDKFVGKKRWGTFPSINGGWRISEEAFVKDKIDWLSNAKLRASWGILGNDAITQFLYETAFIGDQISYSYGGAPMVSGWAKFKVPNSRIKWEEVNQTDLGIDLGFLNNRLSFTYDYYNRQTKDMLYDGNIPLAAGIGYYFSSDGFPTATMKMNAGLMENKGHELTIAWNDKKGDLHYSIGANASFNSNKVKRIGEKFGDATPIDRGIGTDWQLVARTEDGHPMSLFYGYKAIGIFQNQAQVDEYNAKAVAAGSPSGYYQKPNTAPGDLIFDDLGQGWVTPNSQIYIGNPWPKMIYGINMNVDYKGFDLSLLFQGATGFEIFNAVKAYTQVFSGDGNTTKDVFNVSFFGDNGLTDVPRAGYFQDADNKLWISDANANKNYSTVSSYFVEKGNYLKLKNLVVGYSLPKNLAKKISIDNVRLYISAQNVFTWTKYTGIDPEIGGNALARGLDHQNRYLPSRLVSFGLDLTF